MATAAAQAAPDEIQVYTEELNSVGQFGLEQHLNYTAQGSRLPDYPGQLTSHHVSQVTPEFSYGLSDTLEAGLYVPFAVASNGHGYLNGLRLRLKYIAPHAEQGMFYGLNFEWGRQAQRVSDTISTAELRPIIGYRDADWLLSFNPILNAGLAANVSHRPQFDPAFKLGRRVGEGVSAGFEYYGEYGPANRWAPSNTRSHTVYAVVDAELTDFDLNFGIGHGFVGAPDAWVVKSIVALHFD